MRPVFFYGVLGQLALTFFLLQTHAQPEKLVPTRGDGLGEKLEQLEPQLKAKVAELTTQAEADNALAQFELSRRYIYAQGTAPDLKAAFGWAEKSANAGNAFGQFHIAFLFRHGTGVEPDEKKSNEWFAKAAQTLPKLVEAGDAQAMRFLATLHYRGWGGLEQDRRAALKLNQQAAEAGDLLGELEVADQLWDGKGTHRQRSKAKKMYQAILPRLMDMGESGDRQAQYIVGNILAGDRLGQPRDFEESIKWHQPGADAGYASAMFIIGARHQKGHGTPRNDPLAMDWYRKAAEQGQPGAINNVGWMHGRGRAGDPNGVDRAKAAEFYRKAAERGNPVSQNNIGMALYNEADENAPPMDPKKVEAYDWHKRSAENDHGRGQYYLALRFDTGQGTQPDLEKAVYWYKRAADNDIVDAQVKLVDMHFEGRGVPRNLAEALHWMARVTEYDRDPINPFLAYDQQAAKSIVARYGKLRQYLNEGWPAAPRNATELEALVEGEDPVAMYEFGALHALGIGGVSVNIAAAKQWAEKAAAKGHAPAQYFLGICLEEGRLGPRDLKAAKVQYRKAADQGHPAAMNNLAVILEDEEDANGAVSLFTQASKLGNADALYNLGRLLETATEPQLEDAFVLYEKAAAMGHGPAQNNLGRMYLSGEGVEPDAEEAARWFEHAANQNDPNGLYNFGKMKLAKEGGQQGTYAEVFGLWGRAVQQGHAAASKHLITLSNHMANAEQTEGRRLVTTVLPQYFVVREGD